MNQNSPRLIRESLCIGILSFALILCAWKKWLPLDLTESLGFTSGAICVWLVTRNNIWNWPIGLANNIAFAFLFWNARLFADLGLQGIYFILGIWGWYNWLKGGPNHCQLPVTHTRPSEWFSIITFIILGTWLIHELLLQVNGAAPFWDSLTTILCLAAQYLLGQKRLENWFLWMIADLIYIPLYLSRGLPLTALLYAGFIVLCILGFRRWKPLLHAA